MRHCHSAAKGVLQAERAGSLPVLQLRDAARVRNPTKHLRPSDAPRRPVSLTLGLAPVITEGQLLELQAHQGQHAGQGVGQRWIFLEAHRA